MDPLWRSRSSATRCWGLVVFEPSDVNCTGSSALGFSHRRLTKEEQCTSVTTMQNTKDNPMIRCIVRKPSSDLSDLGPSCTASKYISSDPANPIQISLDLHVSSFLLFLFSSSLDIAKGLFPDSNP